MTFRVAIPITIPNARRCRRLTRWPPAAEAPPFLSYPLRIVRYMFDSVDLLERATKAAGADVQLATDDELLAAAVDLEGVRRRVDAAEAHVLAELHSRGTTLARSGLPVGAWLAHNAGISHTAGRRRAEVAVKLRRLLGETDESLTEGRIGTDHARVLARAANPRIAPTIAALQDQLIALAATTSFDRWRREVLAIAELADQDGGHDPSRDQARNELYLNDVGDITHLSGKLTGEAALLVRSAIDAQADRLFRQAHADQQATRSAEPALPSRANLCAQALTELCRTGQAVDLDTTKPPATEVILIVPTSAPEPDGEPASPARSAARMIDGVRLADGTTRTLLCDAMYRPLLVDNLGVPLDMGRAVRFATPAQRRALAVRDGGCVWPGCDKPPGWCDAHHVVPVHDGGATDLANLALQCRHHHGLTHSTDWTMHTAQDGWFWWQTPTGRKLWSQRHVRPRDGPTPES